MKKMLLTFAAASAASAVLMGSVFAHTQSYFGRFTVKTDPGVNFSSLAKKYGANTVLSVNVAESLVGTEHAASFAYAAKISDLAHRINTYDKSSNFLDTNGKPGHLKFGVVIRDNNNEPLYTCVIDKPELNLSYADNVQLHIRSLHNNDCYVTIHS